MTTKYLPFMDSEVPADRSQSQILNSLKDLGFERIASLVDNGEYLILAQYKGASFRFSVDVQEIMKALQPARMTRGYNETKAKAKAERIGWRLMAQQVKASCDLIKYKVNTMAQAFGGNLLVYDKTGAGTSLADIIVADVEAGKRPGVHLLENLSK